MKALVDRLTAEIEAKYVHYIETLLVDLRSEPGFIEFRCGFALRRDHELRRFKLKLGALEGESDDERTILIVVIFEQIEEMIDNAIAERRVDAN